MKFAYSAHILTFYEPIRLFNRLIFASSIGIFIVACLDPVEPGKFTIIIGASTQDKGESEVGEKNFSY